MHLPDHEVFTVTEMAWNGLKNGKLMAKCFENKFDVLLTIDKNLAFQQNIDKYELSIVVLDAPSSKLNDILPLLPIFEQKANFFERRKVYVID